VLKPKLESWNISTWKKTNWRFSVLRRTWRIFVWIRVENEFFLCCSHTNNPIDLKSSMYVW